MKHIKTKHGKTEIIIEKYNDFSEFTTTQDSRTALWTNHSTEQRAIKNDTGFRRCSTFDEAKGLLVHGYEEDVDAMVARVNVLSKTGSAKKTVNYADCVGFAPIVPNALLGLPQSMINQKRVEVKDKVITVIYDPSVPAMVDQSEVLDYGCKVVSYIMNLEKNGFRVRLEYMSCNSDDAHGKPSTQYILRIPLKSEHQPVNVKRLAFAMTHVAMQRYLSFDWMERLPDSHAIYGMGYSLPVCSNYAKESVKSTLAGNEYLVCHGDNLDKVFEQVK